MTAISRNPHVPLSNAFMCCKCKLPRAPKGRKKTQRGWVCAGCLGAK